ncbi:Asp23/Gls24 family envelope stress response protein [Isachenkonia alkalipeptolytica]|nr:Asp23/Gls24 family envelope stress response protein [Isachenkonia alkalipeptolytica]
MINWKVTNGNVYIYDEVLKAIIAASVEEIKGVAGLSPGFMEEIIEGLGKRNHSKGIKISDKNQQMIIDLYVIIEYGTKIPDLSWEIQQNVKRSMENILNIKTSKVNINIQGVLFPNDSK